MSDIDYVPLAIIAISMLIGLWRGFVREALSLAIWTTAFWLAYTWAGIIGVYFSDWINDETIRLVIAFIGLFLAVHIVGFIITRLLAKLIKSIGLTSVDRVAGGGFGLARGVVVVAVLILVAGMTPIAEQELWQQSYMISVFNDALEWVEIYYPLNVTEQFAQVTE